MPETLTIGSVLDSGEPAELNAARFNRHTFWCGQSGSGKTYALGVVLEQLLAHSALPIVIFDPNADFVRLGEVRPEAANSSTAEALAGRDIRVLRPASETSPLRVRFPDLPLAIKAGMLRLDPLVDRAEYNALLHVEGLLSASDERSVVEARTGRSPTSSLSAPTRPFSISAASVIPKNRSSSPSRFSTTSGRGARSADRCCWSSMKPTTSAPPTSTAR